VETYRPAQPTAPVINPVPAAPTVTPEKENLPSARNVFITTGFALIVFAAIFIAAIISNGALFGNGVEPTPSPIIQSPIHHGLKETDTAILAFKTENGRLPSKDEILMTTNFITIGKKVVDITGRTSYLPKILPGQGTEQGTNYCYGTSEINNRFVFGMYNSDTSEGADGIDYSTNSDPTITCRPF